MEPTVATEAMATTAQQGFSLATAFEQGGSAMYVIAFCGLLTMILIFERAMALYRLRVDKEDFTNKLFGMLLRGDLRQALAFCDSIRTPLSQTVKAGLEQVLNQRPDEEVQVAMDGAVLRETPKLEGWTGMLAVMGNVATLVGLLGTIIGLIIAFSGVTDQDPAKKAEILSLGISHALNCTAAGIGVAIPALVAFGFFQIQIGRAISEMQEVSMSLLNLVVANRDKMKG